MIGVQEEYQGCGLGRLFMLHAMKKTLEVADLVGLYALTLDALDDEVAARYQRWGFEKFIEGELSMFIPVPTIRSMMD